jgi:dolichyl-phosphate-mannose--protein O-mannosyl transferase
MSVAKDWPLMTRPIWYAFDKEGSGADEKVRGVILLGNPLIMWAGLVALVGCAWGWISTRGRQAFLILAFYFMFYASWALIPRKIEFYYYYYPAGMVLSFALAYVFYHLEQGSKERLPLARWTFFGMSVVLFIYFFPILAALRIPAQAFRHWMWFSSWI